MRRIVILGPGAAGKTTLARRLGELVDLPVVELDKRFWSPDLAPTPKGHWAAVQVALADEPAWIMDGDLGPYDVVAPRLQMADTVILLDFARWRCTWRAFRRSPERLSFWRWMWRWRRRSRPELVAEIASHAGDAAVEVLQTPAAVERWLSHVATGAADSDARRRHGEEVSLEVEAEPADGRVPNRSMDPLGIRPVPRGTLPGTHQWVRRWP